MKIPPNVEAIIQYANGEIEYVYSPFPVEDLWPEIRVDSASFKMLPPEEKLYQQATAFLGAARSLCEAAGRSGKDLRWSEGSVCWYCLNIAMELFLKACIYRAKGALEKTHDISRLLATYKKILPDTQFHFATPWAVSLKELESIVNSPIGNRIDHSPDQLHRYGIDRKGNGSAGVQCFSPNHFFGYVNYLSNLWSHAWNRICSDQAQSPSVICDFQ